MKKRYRIALILYDSQDKQAAGESHGGLRGRRRGNREVPTQGSGRSEGRQVR
jgi:hypothetical protein